MIQWNQQKVLKRRVILKIIYYLVLIDVDFKPRKRKLPHSDVRSLVSESTLSSFAHAAIESGRNDKDDGASVQHQITSIEFSPSKKSAKQRKLKNINLGECAEL